jgi:hypothetical protein
MQVISEHLKTTDDVVEETVSEQLYGPGGERMVDECRRGAQRRLHGDPDSRSRLHTIGRTAMTIDRGRAA